MGFVPHFLLVFCKHAAHAAPRFVRESGVGETLVVGHAAKTTGSRADLPMWMPMYTSTASKTKSCEQKKKKVCGKKRKPQNFEEEEKTLKNEKKTKSRKLWDH